MIFTYFINIDSGEARMRFAMFVRLVSCAIFFVAGAAWANVGTNAAPRHEAQSPPADYNRMVCDADSVSGVTEMEPPPPLEEPQEVEIPSLEQVPEVSTQDTGTANQERTSEYRREPSEIRSEASASRVATDSQAAVHRPRGKSIEQQENEALANGIGFGIMPAIILGVIAAGVILFLLFRFVFK